MVNINCLFRKLIQSLLCEIDITGDRFVKLLPPHDHDSQTGTDWSFHMLFYRLFCYFLSVCLSFRFSLIWFTLFSSISLCRSLSLSLSLSPSLPLSLSRLFHRYARIIEALLVALVTSVITFTAAMGLGECKKLPKTGGRVPKRNDLSFLGEQRSSERGRVCGFLVDLSSGIIGQGHVVVVAHWAERRMTSMTRDVAACESVTFD